MKWTSQTEASEKHIHQLRKITTIYSNETNLTIYYNKSTFQASLLSNFNYWQSSTIISSRLSIANHICINLQVVWRNTSVLLRHELLKVWCESDVDSERSVRVHAITIQSFPQSGHTFAFLSWATRLVPRGAGNAYPVFIPDFR